MKKTCLTLLAATALPAFAALDIASVDIEGIKLGMNEKESAAIVKAYCEKEKDGIYEETPVSLNEMKFNASICDGGKLNATALDSKTVAIITEQKIDLENPINKEFTKNWQFAVQEKAMQKYGKPALEADNATIMLNGEESKKAQHMLCWGGCKMRSSGSDKSVLEAKGQALFISLNVKEKEATIGRILIDEAAINTTQSNAAKTEAEKAAAKVNL